MSNFCIFCKIIAKEAEAAILYEDSDVLAFLDIQPINDGHTLIVPKQHIERIEDLPNTIYQKVFEVGKSVLKKIQTNFSEYTDFNYVIASGKDAGQDVFHGHLHIIPRKNNDGFGFKFGPNFVKKSLEERNIILKRILGEDTL